MNVINVQSSIEGIETAKEKLYKECDSKTVLFLSGGSTPKPLYEELAREEKLEIGAVAMVDDRYSFHHQFSNEIMIRESGLVSSIEKKNIPFYSILKFGLDLKEIARQYDETIRDLFNKFTKRVAILGVGSDGHIAGILPMYHILIYDTTNKNSLVSAFEYQEGEYRERITLTFKALSEIGYLIVLAFGKEKKKALGEMFNDGPIEQVAARFLNRPDVSKKTILITDQKL